MTTPRPEPQISVATAKSVRLGVLLAAVGGFLDAYTYVTRGGVFAGAQTGNVVLLGVDVAGGRWVEALVFLPPTLVASYFGMNFKHIPELEWLWGYPFALFLMVLSAALPYVYFKRKGWL